jgi:hypothetical protein
MSYMKWSPFGLFLIAETRRQLTVNIGRYWVKVFHQLFIIRKKMKTTLKLIVCVFGAIAISTQCKAQSSNYRHLVDSLKITDPDELAICKLYDDAVTEYFTEWKQYTTNGTKPTPAQQQALNKKFQEREKEIKPQVESFRKKVGSNYQQAMNFAWFCSYEAMRIANSMGFKNGAYPGYPPSANH